MKNTDPKIALLSSLTEKQLRVHVLVPLLRKMGLENVNEYHGGIPEKGKDIVAHYTDTLGARHHVAIVVKRGNIHGAVGKPGNASEVLYQVEQALSEPFSDVYDLQPVDISECWVITSGVIKNTAVESIRGRLTKSNLDKVTRFIDQERLVTLIDRNWPDYWMHDRIMLSLAHEMVAPISSAKSQALYIARHPGPMPDDRARDAALQIAYEMDMLKYLVEFLYLANRQQIDLRNEKVDVEREVTHVAALLGRAAEGKRVRVNVKELPPLDLDLEAFRQCVFNLLRNALQYSTSSSDDVEVSGSLVRDQAIIRIRDFGIGVPEGWEDLIFEQGVRAPNAGRESVPGSGLGLWLVRRLVHLQGGKILLTSRTQPTEFTLYLPIRSSV